MSEGYVEESVHNEVGSVDLFGDPISDANATELTDYSQPLIVLDQTGVTQLNLPLLGASPLTEQEQDTFRTFAPYLSDEDATDIVSGLTTESPAE